MVIFLIVIVPSTQKYDNFFEECKKYIKYMPDYICAKKYNVQMGLNGTTFLVRNEAHELFVFKIHTENEWNQNETSSLKKLKDKKYIIQVYKEKTIGDSHMSILQYAKHATLQKMLLNSTYFDNMDKVMEFFKKLMIGLKSIEEAGLVHAQISLSNIQVMENYEPLISNFGASTAIGSVGSVRGVPIFMAPELVKSLNSKENFQFETSTDVYAAGVILFYMVRQHFPFQNYRMFYSKMLNRTVDFKESSSRLFMIVVMKCLRLVEKRQSISHILEYLDSEDAIDKELSTNYYYILGNTNLYISDHSLEKLRFWIVIFLVMSFLLFFVSMLSCYCHMTLILTPKISSRQAESSRPSDMSNNFINLDEANKDKQLSGEEDQLNRYKSEPKS